MAEQLTVKAELSNQKVQFKGVSRTNTEVFFDYNPPLGDGQGYTGLEMLLMSLAVCSATTVVSLLRNMGKTVAGFEVNAQGTRREEHPTGFQNILLEFVLKSDNAMDSDMEKAIQLSAEAYCPGWAMVKNNVEIRTEFNIRS